MKRIINLQPSEDIARWADDQGSFWRVVAVDLHNGAVHMERVAGHDVPARDESLAELLRVFVTKTRAILQDATLESNGPGFRMKIGPRPRSAAKGRSRAPRSPKG